MYMTQWTNKWTVPFTRQDCGIPHQIFYLGNIFETNVITFKYLKKLVKILLLQLI